MVDSRHALLLLAFLLVRCARQPNHFDSLSFSLAPVMSKIGVRFIAGRVRAIGDCRNESIAVCSCCFEGC